MRKLIASVGVLLLTWSIGSLAADTPPMKFDLAKMTMVVEVEEGISGEDVDESIKSLAATEGIFYVFYAPLYTDRGRDRHPIPPSVAAHDL
jgi:hypothetical protein